MDTHIIDLPHAATGPLRTLGERSHAEGPGAEGHIGTSGTIAGPPAPDLSAAPSGRPGGSQPQVPRPRRPDPAAPGAAGDRSIPDGGGRRRRLPDFPLQHDLSHQHGAAAGAGPATGRGGQPPGFGPGCAPAPRCCPGCQDRRDPGAQGRSPGAPCRCGNAHPERAASRDPVLPCRGAARGTRGVTGRRNRPCGTGASPGRPPGSATGQDHAAGAAPRRWHPGPGTRHGRTATDAGGAHGAASRRRHLSSHGAWHASGSASPTGAARTRAAAARSGAGPCEPRPWKPRWRGCPRRRRSKPSRRLTAGPKSRSIPLPSLLPFRRRR